MESVQSDKISTYSYGKISMLQSFPNVQVYLFNLVTFNVIELSSLTSSSALCTKN